MEEYARQHKTARRWRLFAGRRNLAESAPVVRRRWHPLRCIPLIAGVWALLVWGVTELMLR